jgi:hypothetical protein
MVIKISKGHQGEPPPAGQPADLLWTAEHGSDDDANVNQIAASVLSELAPTFVVGQWYPLADAKQLFQGASGDPQNDVWTEIPVEVPSLSAKGRDSCPMQIRQYKAARIIFDSAVQFAESLEREGAAWIRVE